MRLEFYLAISAIIGVMLFRTHSYFNEKYSGMAYYERQVQALQQEVDRAQLQQTLAQQEQFKYQQSIAMQIPRLMKENPYLARNIASVVSEEEGRLEFDTVKESLSRAKEWFNKGQFENAIEELEPIYKKHTEHALAPEASFLLMESYHFTGKREEASNVIENMLRLYPESFLTGYALLRLADYFEQESDADRAKYLYSFVKEKFYYDPQLVKTATESLQRLRDAD